MPLTETVARPLLAGIFVAGGFDAIRNPEPKVGPAEPVADALGRPVETVELVRLNGAVQVTAGSLLAVGRLPRLSAAALAVSLIPTTFAGHRFWAEEDRFDRAQQRTQFLKNLGLLGGLVLAATDTEGRPSLRWTLTHRGRPRANPRAATARAAHKAAELGRHSLDRGDRAAHRIARWTDEVAVPETRMIVDRVATVVPQLLAS